MTRPKQVKIAKCAQYTMEALVPFYTQDVQSQVCFGLQANPEPLRNRQYMFRATEMEIRPYYIPGYSDRYMDASQVSPLATWYDLIYGLRSIPCSSHRAKREKTGKKSQRLVHKIETGLIL